MQHTNSVRNLLKKKTIVRYYLIHQIYNSPSIPSSLFNCNSFYLIALIAYEVYETVLKISYDIHVNRLGKSILVKLCFSVFEITSKSSILVGRLRQYYLT